MIKNRFNSTPSSSANTSSTPATACAWGCDWGWHRAENKLCAVWKNSSSDWPLARKVAALAVPKVKRSRAARQREDADEDGDDEEEEALAEAEAGFPFLSLTPLFPGIGRLLPLVFVLVEL